MEASPLSHGDSQRALMRQNDINERMRTIAGQLTCTCGRVRVSASQLPPVHTIAAAPR
jgi:hypothetical protein